MEMNRRIFLQGKGFFLMPRRIQHKWRSERGKGVEDRPTWRINTLARAESRNWRIKEIRFWQIKQTQIITKLTSHGKGWNFNKGKSLEFGLKVNPRTLRPINQNTRLRKYSDGDIPCKSGGEAHMTTNQWKYTQENGNKRNRFVNKSIKIKHNPSNSMSASNKNIQIQKISSTKAKYQQYYTNKL